MESPTVRGFWRKPRSRTRRLFLEARSCGFQEASIRGDLTNSCQLTYLSSWIHYCTGHAHTVHSRCRFGPRRLEQVERPSPRYHAVESQPVEKQSPQSPPTFPGSPLVGVDVDEVYRTGRLSSPQDTDQRSFSLFSYPLWSSASLDGHP